MRQKENQKKIFFPKGSVAVFALILMFILAVATIGIITTATIERKTSISTGNSTTAFQIAESGMEKTLQYFKSNFDKTLNDINGPANCSGGIVRYDPQSMNTIRFKDNATPTPNDLACADLISKVKIIKSIGTTKQETRAIEEDIFLGATKLLLHLNGKNSDNPARFEDSSYYYNNNHTISDNSGVSESTSLKKFGGGSASFNGTTGYLSIPDSSDWNFGTGDFTIDFWLSLSAYNNTAGDTTSISQAVNVSNGWYIFHSPVSRKNQIGFISSNGAGFFFMTSAAGAAWNPALNTFYHIAIVRNGTTPYIFINGVSQALTIVTNFGNFGDISAPLNIGYLSGVSNSYFAGNIDELRISKGIARWTSNFTRPTKEYWPD